MNKIIPVPILGIVFISGLAIADPAPFQGARYICSQQGRKSFAITNDPGCMILPRESGWENALSSPSIIVDVQPESVVRDNDGAKVWVRIYLNQSYPYVTAQGQTKGNYDGLKGVYKFLCGKRQQIIMQADYLNAGSPVYYRLSNEADTEEIEPGTVVETLYKKYCPG